MAGKPKRPTRAARGDSPPAPAREQPAAVAEPAAPPAGLSRGRLWLFRLLAVVGGPLVFVTAAETALRLVGWGYPTSFFLAREGGRLRTHNERFAWQFYSPKSRLKPHPFVISHPKPPGTLRLFVLGESAAFGTPDAAYGLTRVLDRLLRLSFPTQRWEVVNAAMPGINSHIMRVIARECAQQQPDLFVIYAGNNEVVGLHAPEPGRRGLTGRRWLLRLLQAARSSRLGQGLTALTSRWQPNQPDEAGQDQEFFRRHRLAADDPGRQAVYDNFRANLAEILDGALASGARVVLSTVAVNLRDCPPLGSLHRREVSAADRGQWEALYSRGATAEAQQDFAAAIEAFTAAAAIDDHYAELHFRLARCLEAAGQVAAAREHYRLACDHDALPFRADHRVNQIIRELAARYRDRGLIFVDTEQELARQAGGESQVPGEDLFYEHVHYRFVGNYLLASNLFPRVVAALADRLGVTNTAAVAVPSLAACTEALAFTPVKEAELTRQMLDLQAHPPFTDQWQHAERMARLRAAYEQRFGRLGPRDWEQAVTACERALVKYPEDWALHYQLGRLQFKRGHFAEAVRAMRAAKQHLPYDAELRLGIARSLMEAGQLVEATAEVEELLRLDPKHKGAALALEVIQAKRRGHRVTPER